MSYHYSAHRSEFRAATSGKALRETREERGTHSLVVSAKIKSLGTRLDFLISPIHNAVR